MSKKNAAPEISELPKPRHLDNDDDIFFTWIHGEYAFLGIFAGSNL